MTFKNLRLSGWRQFKAIDIDFHHNLTVITGANGAGKTTLLNVLSPHYGWQGHLVSTPMSSGALGGGYTYLSDLWDRDILSLAESIFKPDFVHFSGHGELRRGSRAARQTAGRGLGPTPAREAGTGQTDLPGRVRR
jgi:hypothetical protein